MALERLERAWARARPPACSCCITGAGTDERDLIGLADALDPERRLRSSGRGPLQLSGSPGYHWYLVPRVGYPDPETFFAARAALAELHDGLWADGIAPERTVLGGFSMGSVMSYAMGSAPTARRRGDPRLQRLRAERRGLAARRWSIAATRGPSSPTAATTR